MFQALGTFFLSGARCWDADSERSYQDLFDRLDTNKDGKVDVAELRAGLKAMGIFRHGAAQVDSKRGGDPVRKKGGCMAHSTVLWLLTVCDPKLTCTEF